MPMGAYIFAEVLKRYGVERVFTLCGGHLDPLFFAMKGVGIDIVDTRHEMSAVFMATAYARLKRTVGIAMATAGPGVTNTVTGVLNAREMKTPVIVVGGKAPMKQWELGAFQDIDQIALMGPITEGAFPILSAERIPEYIALAWRRAVERMGPCYLDVPLSTLLENAEDPKFYPKPEFPKPAPSDKDLQKAEEILSKAERPIVIVGSGILWSEAEEDVKNFCEMTLIPGFTTPLSKGIFLNSNVYLPGARGFAFKNADVVLVLGTRFNFIIYYGRPPRFSEKAKFIHVTLEEGGRTAELVMLSDVGEFIRKLDIRKRWDEWFRVVEEKHRENQEKILAIEREDKATIHPLRALGELKKFIGNDCIVAADGGDSLSFARISLEAERWLDPGPLGCLGIGLPYAISAKICFPERRVVCVTGDGSLGLTFMEFEVAVRKKIPVVVVVLNDSAWGLVKHGQEAIFGKSVGCELSFVRYDLMAKDLGGFGVLVEEPSSLARAFDEAFSSGRPAVVNVKVEDVKSPDVERMSKLLLG